MEEYYDRQSRHILDTIVDTLGKDKRHKFIWEEMSYLERWWRDASEIRKESFINLVSNGQLEIVGGDMFEFSLSADAIFIKWVPRLFSLGIHMMKHKHMLENVDKKRAVHLYLLLIIQMS